MRFIFTCEIGESGERLGKERGEWGESGERVRRELGELGVSGDRVRRGWERVGRKWEVSGERVGP